MSWKMHFLVNSNTGSTVKNAMLAKLDELGYVYTYNSPTLTVTINGVEYAAKFNPTYNSNSTSFYMFVNDETGDLLITCTHGGTGTLSNSICLAILSGTNLEDGTNGLFPVASTATTPSYVVSGWGAGSPSNLILLRKLVFFKNAGFCDYNFESAIYEGSTRHAPGIVISVGSDYFVCLAGAYYAKL